jgi:hypothetical protein
MRTAFLAAVFASDAKNAASLWFFDISAWNDAASEGAASKNLAFEEALDLITSTEIHHTRIGVQFP